MSKLLGDDEAGNDYDCSSGWVLFISPGVSLSWLVFVLLYYLYIWIPYNTILSNAEFVMLLIYFCHKSVCKTCYSNYTIAVIPC